MGRRRFHAAFILYKTLGYPELRSFMEEMNREALKVTGLKGNYKLLIDDEEIGIWSGDELAKGINLAAESKTQIGRAHV